MARKDSFGIYQVRYTKTSLFDSVNNESHQRSFFFKLLLVHKYTKLFLKPCNLLVDSEFNFAWVRSGLVFNRHNFNSKNSLALGGYPKDKEKKYHLIAKNKIREENS